MSAHVQIDCIGIDDRLDPYGRIVRVGGPNSPKVPAPDTSRMATSLRQRGFAIADGPRWSLPLADAIEGVLEGKWTFFAQFGAREIVNIEVAKSPEGTLYLKAEVDGDVPEHLLSLPRCG